MNEKNSFQKHTLQKHTQWRKKSNTLNKSFFFFADGNRSGGTCQKKKEIKWAYLMRREINDWKYSNEKRN